MNIRPVTCREEVLLADLHTLTIVSGLPPDFDYEPANMYVSCPTEDDVYIGELAGACLRNLVCQAPKLAQLLQLTQTPDVQDEIYETLWEAFYL